MAVRVFLVEDMKQVQGAVTDLLSTVGDFDVVAAVRTEAEAKLWLQENPGCWDLGVIDLVLEQGSGMGVIADARAQSRGTGARIVVFSDYATQGIRQHCRNLGADAVFGKAEDVQAFASYCAELGGEAVSP